MKRFFKTALILLLLCLCILTVSANDGENINFTVNGKKVDTSEYGQSVYFTQNTSDEPIIPLKAFTSIANAEEVWSADGNKVTVTINDTECVFTIGKNSFTKNGMEFSIDIPLTIVSDTVMISVDTLTDAFDARVKFNDKHTYLAISVEPQKTDDTLVTTKKPENLPGQTSKAQKGGWHQFLTVVKAINVGFVTTFKLFLFTLLGAIPLGLCICFCSISKIKPIRWLSRTLVWIIRGTPLMLQLMIIYYIPGIAGFDIWKGMDGRFIATTLAFIINYAFYFSEIYRGGIENIPKGQIEAGQVLGMTKTQIFFNVTLLQMVKRIVPPMSNEIITLAKDTSIARIISLPEVIWAGYAFIKGSHGYSGLLWPIFFTGVYYLLFTGVLTVLLGKLEKKLSYF